MASHGITTAPRIDVSSLCRELPIGWTAADMAELESEFPPYLSALRHYLSLGVEIPSHIQGAGSVCVPITPVTTPEELFRQAAGSVGCEKYRVDEFADYWITVHFSTVPVVILLLKKSCLPLPKLAEFCGRCSRFAGGRVGGPNSAYFQMNLPGFGWTLHTDDEYEGVASRVHLPLVTTPQNVFAWAPDVSSKREDWLLEVFLERGKVYQVRTDVPHTAINRHPSQARLHLILDVTPDAQ